MAIGPLVLVLTGTEGWPPFLAAAALIAISGAPLLFAADVAPDVSGTSSIPLPVFLVIAPTALLLNGVYAATDMAFLTFLPIYTIDLGLGEASSLTLLTIAGVGGFVFQLPMGWLADRVDRHLLVIVTVSIVIAGAAAMPFVIAVETWNMVFMFVFGGMFASLYSFALVLLGERFRGADLASASVAFGVMWGVGSVAGPPISGATMELLEPHGLPIVIGAAFALYLPVPIWEYVKRRRRHRS
jgi:MFS family permease